MDSGQQGSKLPAGSEDRQREVEDLRNFSTQATGQIARMVEQYYQRRNRRPAPQSTPAAESATQHHLSEVTEAEPSQTTLASADSQETILAEDQATNAAATNSQQRQGVFFAAEPPQTPAMGKKDGLRKRHPAGYLHETYQHIPHWPFEISNVCAEPLENPLPVPVRAPPGLTEDHFCFANERGEYLAQCGPNTDFSKTVFLNKTWSRPSKQHRRTPVSPVAPTQQRPDPDLQLFNNDEASHIQAVFIAKVAAMRARAQHGPQALPEHEQRKRKLAPGELPHCDGDDDSNPAHYKGCAVCRGIRARAIPAEHWSWASKDGREEGEATMPMHGVVTRGGSRRIASNAAALATPETSLASEQMGE